MWSIAVLRFVCLDCKWLSHSSHGQHGTSSGVLNLHQGPAFHPETARMGASTHKVRACMKDFQKATKHDTSCITSSHIIFGTMQLLVGSCASVISKTSRAQVAIQYVYFKVKAVLIWSDLICSALLCSIVLSYPVSFGILLRERSIESPLWFTSSPLSLQNRNLTSVYWSWHTRSAYIGSSLKPEVAASNDGRKQNKWIDSMLQGLH